jgi:hypothetical protein
VKSIITGIKANACTMSSCTADLLVQTGMYVLRPKAGNCLWTYFGIY